MTCAYLLIRDRGSSYRLARIGDRTPLLLAGETSRALGNGDLSRGRGERVYESYPSLLGDLARSFLKSSRRGEKLRRGGERGLALQLSSLRGLRDRLLKAGERLLGRDGRLLPPGVYVSADARPRRGGEPRLGGGELRRGGDRPAR
jgi:hypothetical protein